MSEVFTPLKEDFSERLRFDMDEIEVISGDLDQRGTGRKAIVSINDTLYEVVGIDCSLENCACDAYIKPVTNERS